MRVMHRADAGQRRRQPADHRRARAVRVDDRIAFVCDQLQPNDGPAEDPAASASPRRAAPLIGPAATARIGSA